MAFFQYKAVTPAGEVQEGVLEASSSQAAVARLQEMGFIPIRAEEAGGAKSASTLSAIGLISTKTSRTPMGKLTVFPEMEAV